MLSVQWLGALDKEGFGMTVGVWKRSFLMVALSLCLMSTVAQAATTPYSDPAGRFALVIPDGYQQGVPLAVPDGATGVQFVSAVGPGINFNVVTADDPMNSQAGLDQLSLAATAEVQQLLTDVQFGQDGLVLINFGGQNARQFTYVGTAPNSGVRVRGTIVVALRGNTSYSLAFTARDENAPILAEKSAAVISSFNFK